MKKFPLLTVIPKLHDDFGLELDEDTAINYAMSAYKKIGNNDFRLKLIIVHPEKDPEGGWSVCRPCDMEQIEAITLPFEGGREVNATDDFLGYKTYAIEQWIENFKWNRDHFYLSGKFVKYIEYADKINFTDPYPTVNILYKASYLDEDGLPYVSEKELEAIVMYCAYAYDMKQARLTKDQSLLQFAQNEYQHWQRLCSSARVADQFSQNEINEILDTLTSMGVHSYGVSSTKPIQ